MKSILQTEKECYVCKTTYNLHSHHIFDGGNRKISERMGFKVWLCAYHHNFSNEGVHFNRVFDNFLKQECQRKFEENHSREEFMEIIGRSYID